MKQILTGRHFQLSALTLLGLVGFGCSHNSPINNDAKLSSCPSEFKNPVIWQDLPDPEVIRVDDTYYYTASTFHHSPGAPVLRSYDLVNWEYLSHSVPALDFDPLYNLEGGNAYVKGIWASTLQYRQSNQTFYWMGCMHNLGGSYVFTSKSPAGPWQKHATEHCYYDMGLLIEQSNDTTTDKMYVAWGQGTIYVSELSADSLKEVRREVVFETPEDLSGPLEGARFYNINGDYYIWLTQYANGEYVARSTNGPFGPYELMPLAVATPYAGEAEGSGIAPHQGGIVQTQNGDWYYMAFTDAFPAGRLPVMAPLHWKDGWPEVQLIDGAWGAAYPFPNLPCGADKVTAQKSKYTFNAPELEPEWEWNHNPDNTRWRSGSGLKLQTATVTNDFYNARNTLTQRIEGPRSIATIELNYSKMQNGDVAGLATLRDKTAWIGVKKINGKTRVAMVNDVILSTDRQTTNAAWQTIDTGGEIAGLEVTGGKIWLRVDADIRSTDDGGTARFFYSTDGKQFMPLGNKLLMERRWNYFLGYRFGIFNYATNSLGGSVTIDLFESQVESF